MLGKRHYELEMKILKEKEKRKYNKFGTIGFVFIFFLFFALLLTKSLGLPEIVLVVLSIIVTVPISILMIIINPNDIYQNEKIKLLENNFAEVKEQGLRKFEENATERIRKLEEEKKRHEKIVNGRI